MKSLSMDFKFFEAPRRAPVHHESRVNKVARKNALFMAYLWYLISFNQGVNLNHL
jgi:hypothetical protein